MAGFIQRESIDAATGNEGLVRTKRIAHLARTNRVGEVRNKEIEKRFTFLHQSPQNYAPV